MQRLCDLAVSSFYSNTKYMYEYCTGWGQVIMPSLSVPAVFTDYTVMGFIASISRNTSEL